MATRKERIAQNKKTMGKQYGASIKIGAKGKNYNRYNPKTGKWEKVISAGGAKPKMTPAKPKAKPASRSTTSGTVTSAVARGRRGGAGSGDGVPAGQAQGRGGLPVEAAAQTARANRGQRRPQIPGTNKAIVKNKAAADRRNAGRDAAAIAALTLGPIVAGGAMAAGGSTAGAVGGRAAIEAARRAALPAGRKAIEASGRVVKGTPSRAPQRVTLTDLRGQATARGVSSGQVPRAALPAGPQRAIAGPVKPPPGISRTGGPATAKGNPALVNRPARPTAAQKKKMDEYERTRPAKLPPGARRDSPIGRQVMDGRGSTGPKTKAQATAAARSAAGKKGAEARAAKAEAARLAAAARSEAARKAAATRAANKLRGMK